MAVCGFHVEIVALIGPPMSRASVCLDGSTSRASVCLDGSLFLKNRELLAHWM
eukprot:COSAG01_NODE_6061_length_3874_cov_1.743379_6_plen_53_part_00